MSTTPAPSTAANSSRRWQRGLVAVLLLAALGGGAWWYFRANEKPPPEPPSVDLSRAEPEVARAIQSAINDVRAKPRDAGAWGKLGMLLLAHDFDAESRSVFRTAAELDPADYRWPYLEGLTRVLYDPDAGLERLRRAAELAPANRPEPQLRLAELLIERGELDEAAKLVDLVLGGSPSARAELLSARIAAARGNWQRVLDATASCTHDPDCRRAATLLRGRAFAARGEREKADTEFRAAEKLPEGGAWPDPVVAEVESLRVGTSRIITHAAAMIEQGQAREAIELLESTVKAAPSNPTPSLLLGRAQIQAGNPHEARRVLEEHVARFPNSVEGWFNLGVAQFQSGDPKGAADAFRQTTQLKADHALAHFNLGHCYRKLGDKTAAKAAFEEALRCRPDYQAAREALANLAAGKE